MNDDLAELKEALRKERELRKSFEKQIKTLHDEMAGLDTEIATLRAVKKIDPKSIELLETLRARIITAHLQNEAGGPE